MWSESHTEGIKFKEFKEQSDMQILHRTQTVTWKKFMSLY